MKRIIPLLIEDPTDPFDVVAPSVPGFGFSDHPAEPGMNSEKVAGLWAKLMQGLGYDRYGAHGGDIGAGISTWLAYNHPGNVIGLHLNYIPGAYNPDPGTVPLTEEEKQYLQRREQWIAEEGGYSHLQSTRPQSLAGDIREFFRQWRFADESK